MLKPLPVEKRGQWPNGYAFNRCIFARPRFYRAVLSNSRSNSRKQGDRLGCSEVVGFCDLHGALQGMCELGLAPPPDGNTASAVTLDFCSN